MCVGSMSYDNKYHMHLGSLAKFPSDPATLNIGWHCKHCETSDTLCMCWAGSGGNGWIQTVDFSEVQYYNQVINDCYI